MAQRKNKLNLYRVTSHWIATAGYVALASDEEEAERRVRDTFFEGAEDYPLAQSYRAELLIADFDEPGAFEAHEAG